MREQQLHGGVMASENSPVQGRPLIFVVAGVRVCALVEFSLQFVRVARCSGSDDGVLPGTKLCFHGVMFSQQAYFNISLREG